MYGGGAGFWEVRGADAVFGGTGDAEEEVTVVVDGEVAEDLTGVEIFCQLRCQPLCSWQNRTEGWVAVVWEKAQVVLHTLYTYVSHFRKGQLHNYDICM